MTLTDYLLDIALIAVVFLQVRGRRLSARGLLLPVALVAWAAVAYLHAIPTAGNHLVLVAAGALSGIALGVLCALFTTVRRGPTGHLVARAGVVAAVLWVVGVGTRLAFQLFATHGGAPAIGRFMEAHAITTPEAWVAALILMAMGEALARTAVLAVRAYGVSPSHFLGRAAIMDAR